MSDEALLQVDGLTVTLDSAQGPVQAVRGVSFSLQRGQTLALVGESGCGKSVCALSLMGLLPASAHCGGSLRLDGRELLALDESQWRCQRGNRIALISQNPMSSLNPTMSIGEQIAEPLRLHRGLTRAQALREAARLLDHMHIARAAERCRQYPFEFSGGMLQRVAIAMAMACEPQLLIADEPTTALDVTVQDQVLSLLQALQREREMALLLISHDLAVVARMADSVAVMYAGQLVEQGAAEDIYYRAAHPYTRALLAALPERASGGDLAAIPGSPPSLLAPPPACAFAARCAQRMHICMRQGPGLLAVDARHASRCWLQHPMAGAGHDE